MKLRNFVIFGLVSLLFGALPNGKTEATEIKCDDKYVIESVLVSDQINKLYAFFIVRRSEDLTNAKDNSVKTFGFYNNEEIFMRDDDNPDISTILEWPYKSWLDKTQKNIQTWCNHLDCNCTDSMIKELMNELTSFRTGKLKNIKFQKELTLKKKSKDFDTFIKLSNTQVRKNYEEMVEDQPPYRKEVSQRAWVSHMAVSPDPVISDQKFTVDFTLEIKGEPITFEYVKVDIIRETDNSLLSNLETYSNQLIPANGKKNYSPTETGKNLSGTYKAIVKGKTAESVEFVFETTESGKNPITFNVSSVGGRALISKMYTKPDPVDINKDFTIYFTLKEVGGSSVKFEQIKAVVLNSDDSDLSNMVLSNITIPANKALKYTAKCRIDDNNPPGTYKIVIRGKETGGEWFDFDVTDAYSSDREHPMPFKVTSSVNDADSLGSIIGEIGNLVHWASYYIIPALIFSIFLNLVLLIFSVIIIKKITRSYSNISDVLHYDGFKLSSKKVRERNFSALVKDVLEKNIAYADKKTLLSDIKAKVRKRRDRELSQSEIDMIKYCIEPGSQNLLLLIQSNMNNRFNDIEKYILSNKNDIGETESADMESADMEKQQRDINFEKTEDVYLALKHALAQNKILPFLDELDKVIELMGSEPSLTVPNEIRNKLNTTFKIEKELKIISENMGHNFESETDYFNIITEISKEYNSIKEVIEDCNDLKEGDNNIERLIKTAYSRKSNFESAIEKYETAIKNIKEIDTEEFSEQSKDDVIQHLKTKYQEYKNGQKAVYSLLTTRTKKDLDEFMELDVCQKWLNTIEQRVSLTDESAKYVSALTILLTYIKQILISVEKTEKDQPILSLVSILDNSSTALKEKKNIEDYLGEFTTISLGNDLSDNVKTICKNYLELEKQKTSIENEINKVTTENSISLKNNLLNVKIKIICEEYLKLLNQEKAIENNMIELKENITISPENNLSDKIKIIFENYTKLNKLSRNMLEYINFPIRDTSDDNLDELNIKIEQELGQLEPRHTRLGFSAISSYMENIINEINKKGRTGIVEELKLETIRNDLAHLAKNLQDGLWQEDYVKNKIMKLNSLFRAENILRGYNLESKSNNPELFLKLSRIVSEACAVIRTGMSRFGIKDIPVPILETCPENMSDCGFNSNLNKIAEIFDCVKEAAANKQQENSFIVDVEYVPFVGKEGNPLTKKGEVFMYNYSDWTNRPDDDKKQ